MSETPKRVLICGGVARSLILFRKHLLQTLVERHHEVMATAGDADPGVTDQLHAHGVRYRCVPLARTGMNPTTDLVYAARMRRLVAEWSPHTILTYTHKPNTFGVLGAAGAGRAATRIFSMVTGLGSVFTGDTRTRDKAARWALETLYRRSTRHLAGILFQNPDDCSLFRERGLMPPALAACVVGGSGVDLQAFSSAPVPDGPVRFLMVSRLLPGKGVREFVEAARALRNRYPAAECHVIGPTEDGRGGVSRSDVATWVQEGLITYHGEQDDVRPFLSASSVFVLPSYYGEGTPRSVLEALAIGRAVITTDTAGCRETVAAPGPLGPDGIARCANGFLVRPRSAEALSRAMTAFLDEPGLVERMGGASRRLAETRYDVGVVTGEMLRFMDL